jgi:hypothetical protein
VNSSSEIPKSELEDNEPDRPVVHNHEHDFECLFWIGLWLVTRRVKNKPIDAYKLVFSHSLEATGLRYSFFTAGFPNLYHQLHSSLKCFADPLDDLRQRLCSECHTINDLPLSDSIEEIASHYSYVVSRPFEIFFDDIEKTRSEWGKIRITPISANPKIRGRGLQVKPSEVITKTRTAQKRKLGQEVEEPGVGGDSQLEGSRTKKAQSKP